MTKYYYNNLRNAFLKKNTEAIKFKMQKIYWGNQNKFKKNAKKIIINLQREWKHLTKCIQYQSPFMKY